MEKKYYAPLFTEDGPILPKDAKPEDFKIWYDDGKKKKACLVECSEEVSKEFQRDTERDKKRRQRQMQKAEKEGETYAPPLSYDSLKLSYEMESLDATRDLDLVTKRVAFYELLAQLESRYPYHVQLLRMTFAGMSQRNIAKALGKSQATIKEQIQKAIELMKSQAKK